VLASGCRRLKRRHLLQRLRPRHQQHQQPQPQPQRQQQQQGKGRNPQQNQQRLWQRQPLAGVTMSQVWLHSDSCCRLTDTVAVRLQFVACLSMCGWPGKSALLLPQNDCFLGAGSVRFGAANRQTPLPRTQLVSSTADITDWLLVGFCFCLDSSIVVHALGCLRAVQRQWKE
jgi:hypothetical protein